MIRWIGAAYLLLTLQPAFGYDVAARLSPLPLVAGDGTTAGTADIAFGQRFTVIAANGGVLEIADADGQRLTVLARDTVILPSMGVALRPADGAAAALAGTAEGNAAGTVVDRPDLPLWDSGLRARAYLGGAIETASAPLLGLPGGIALPDTPLPVLSAQRVATSVGTEVTLVEALFPLHPETLALGLGATDEIVLHVIADGSDYARGFALKALEQMSRRLADSSALQGQVRRASRQVMYDSGELRDEGDIPVSGLRAEWPLPDAPNGKGDLTSALARSIDQLAEYIVPGDGAAHFILILPGPGLTDSAAALEALRAAGDRLARSRAAGAELRGMLLVQATPEPNPANDAVLAALANGVPTRSLGFAQDPVAALASLLSDTQGTELASVGSDCVKAIAAGLPCLSALSGDVPDGLVRAFAQGQSLQWVAVPLWFVADSAPYRLVPQGLTTGEAAPLQADILACIGSGHVWLSGEDGCTVEGSTSPDIRDAALLRQLDDMAAQAEAQGAALGAAVSELSAVRAEHAAVQDDWAVRLADIEVERNALADDLATARLERDALSSQLDEAAERIVGLGGQVTSLQNDLSIVRDAHAQAILAVEEAAAAADAAAVAAERQAADMTEVSDRQIAALEADLFDMVAQLSEATRELSDTKTAAEDEKRALTARLDDARAHRADLDQALSEATDRIAALTAELTTQSAAAQYAQAEATASLEAAIAAERDARMATEQGLNAKLETALTQVRQLEILASDLTRAGDGIDSKLASLGAQFTAERDKREAAEAALAKAQAELITAEGVQAEIARLLAERDALVARAELADAAQKDAARLASELQSLRAQTARLAETAAPVPVAPPTLAAGEAVATAAPGIRPRSRPAVPEPVPERALVATTSAAPVAPTVPAPAGLGVLSTEREAQPAAKRRVAPSQQSPQLNGCQFQWVGQEGRMLCP